MHHASHRPRAFVGQFFFGLNVPGSRHVSAVRLPEFFQRLPHKPMAVCMKRS